MGPVFASLTRHVLIIQNLFMWICIEACFGIALGYFILLRQDMMVPQQPLFASRQTSVQKDTRTMAEALCLNVVNSTHREEFPLLKVNYTRSVWCRIIRETNITPFQPLVKRSDLLKGIGLLIRRCALDLKSLRRQLLTMFEFLQPQQTEALIRNDVSVGTLLQRRLLSWSKPAYCSVHF